MSLGLYRLILWTGCATAIAFLQDDALSHMQIVVLMLLACMGAYEMGREKRG